MPWEDFRTDIEAVTETKPEERKSNAGRKPYDTILKFKIMVLQSLLQVNRNEPCDGFSWALSGIDDAAGGLRFGISTTTRSCSGRNFITVLQCSDLRRRSRRNYPRRGCRGSAAPTNVELGVEPPVGFLQGLIGRGRPLGLVLLGPVLVIARAPLRPSGPVVFD